MVEVPPLEAKMPGPVLRALSLVSTGIREVTAQIRPYTSWWSDQNQEAIRLSSKRLVVIGDSSALGIGASAPELSYVGRLVESLTLRDGTEWHAINLSQSGARTSDGLERQQPIAAAIPDVDLTVVNIGSNDVVWGADIGDSKKNLGAIVESLHSETIVCEVAGGSPRAKLLNRSIRSQAQEHGFESVNPWAEPGPGPLDRLAADRFHPNDIGYALMTMALARKLGAPTDLLRAELGMS